MIEVEGVGRVLRAFDRLEDAIKDEVKVQVRETAGDVKDVARQLVPVLTGRLQDSIEFEIRRDGFEADIGSNVEYADAIERGTASSPAQPYLLPALENARLTVREHWPPAIERRIAEVGRGGR